MANLRNVNLPGHEGGNGYSLFGRNGGNGNGSSGDGNAGGDKNIMKSGGVGSEATVYKAYTVTVNNLPLDQNEASLRHLFESFGQVVAVSIRRHEITGRSKGFGYVSFVKWEDTQKAIKSLNGFIWNGQKLQVAL